MKGMFYTFPKYEGNPSNSVFHFYFYSRNDGHMYKRRDDFKMSILKSNNMYIKIKKRDIIEIQIRQA